MSPEAQQEHIPPHGCTWRRYLEALALAHGGWTALTDLMIHRARGLVELPDDPQSIERGLRRLAGRGNAPGGQYGRWALRFFGVPAPLMASARWMGQYHSRFSDLPVSLCETQLRLWDRPPICESRAAAWIHLGFASIAMRRAREDEALARLARALPMTSETPLATIESLLLAARLASDDPAGLPAELRGQGRAELLNMVGARLQALEPTAARTCYEARWLDQRAYATLHPVPASSPPPSVEQLREARDLYAAIEDNSELPFVAFRRAHGLAYCAWKLGAIHEARAHAHAASEHAGDGGLIRFRAMALLLLARVSEEPATSSLRRRAARLARQIEHEDLLVGPA